MSCQACTGGGLAQVVFLEGAGGKKPLFYRIVEERPVGLGTKAASAAVASQSDTRANAVRAKAVRTTDARSAANPRSLDRARGSVPVARGAGVVLDDAAAGNPPGAEPAHAHSRT